MAVQDDTGNSEMMPHSKTLTISFKAIQIDRIATDGSLTDNRIIKTQKSTIRPLLHAKRHGHAPIVSSWDVLVHVFGVGVSTPFKRVGVFVEQYETNSRQEALRISRA